MLSQVVTRGELLGPQSVTIPSIIPFAQTITLGRMPIRGWLWQVWVSAYAEASHDLGCDILSEVFGIETTRYVLIIRALQGWGQFVVLPLPGHEDRDLESEFIFHQEAQQRLGNLCTYVYVQKRCCPSSFTTKHPSPQWKWSDCKRWFSTPPLGTPLAQSPAKYPLRFVFSLRNPSNLANIDSDEKGQ